MREKNKKPVIANALTSVATSMLSSAANSRCIFLFHQPRQPEGVKKFRKY